MLDSDYTQRFLFDNTDVRGEWVGLERSYAEVLAKHAYPEPVAQLLGELLAAAALLVGTLKFDGLMVLQARSAGAVPLLMVECSSDREVRGIARYHEEQLTPGATLAELMPEGVLAMTIDPTNGQRYQGIVALDGATLAESLSNYFASSEQLPIDRIRNGEEREASWQHLRTLADTLSAEELLGLDTQTVLHRLYHEEQVRLFEPRPITFRCSCSRERSANAVISLGQHDAEQLLSEQGGAITIDCQFCNHSYRFDAADIAQLFAGAGTEGPSGTRH